MLIAHMTLASGIAVVAAAGLAQVPADTFALADVAVNGSRRVPVAEALKAGGLTIGQDVTVAEVGRAANRLIASGLFKSVRYRYVTLDRTITVTFDVEDVDGGVPVAFDNFVWFSEEELAAAVRTRLSTFDGTAPAAEAVLDTIRQSLSTLLASRGLPGQVGYTPDVDLEKGLRRHVFAVINPGPTLCALRFDGTSAVAPRDLLGAVPNVVGQEYSRVRLERLAAGTLTEVYRQRGFWGAAFSGPVATLEKGCGGVTAALAVREGTAFAFDRVEWSGNTALPSTRLDALFGMRSGELADLRTLQAGLREIAAAYGRQGYVANGASYVPRLDDTARRVTFAVTVDEGPQFRMGSVEFAGFSEREVQELTRKWRLAPGDIYDAEYPREFIADHVMPLLRYAGQSAQTPTFEVRLDSGTRLASLRFRKK